MSWCDLHGIKAVAWRRELLTRDYVLQHTQDETLAETPCIKRTLVTCTKTATGAVTSLVLLPARLAAVGPISTTTTFKNVHTSSHKSQGLGYAPSYARSSRMPGHWRGAGGSAAAGMDAMQVVYQDGLPHSPAQTKGRRPRCLLRQAR